MNWRKIRKEDKEYLLTITESEWQMFPALLRSRKDAVEILRVVLPFFKETNYWHGIAELLFYQVSTYEEFKEYSQFILDHYVLYFPSLVHVLHTTWGLDYVFNHLERFCSKQTESRINALFEVCLGNKERETKFLYKVLSCQNQNIRDCYMIEVLENDYPMEEKYLIAALYEDPFAYLQDPIREHKINKSRIPYFLKVFAYKNSRNEEILLRHFAVCFASESEHKMLLFHNIMDKVPQEILDKYDYLIRLFKMDSSKFMDTCLTIYLNSGDTSFIKEILGKNSIQYENGGTTTKVYKIGNERILKMTQKKHTKMNEYKFFLFAPTDYLIVTNETGEAILYLENQSFSEKVYDGKEMTKEEIAFFMEEAKRYGYCIDDPHCKNFDFDNFGYLKSYKDANLDGFVSPEDLPEWFKKRPLVMFDMDMVRKVDLEQEKSGTVKKLNYSTRS